MATAVPTAPLVTQREAAELFRVSLETIRRACRRGEIPTVKVGARRVLIPRHYVEAVLAGHDPSVVGEVEADDGRAA